MQWAQWLSNFFCIDSVLPYSFLGLLNTQQMISLLNSPNLSVVIKDMPLFGAIASVEYHVALSRDTKVSDWVSGNILKVFDLEVQQCYVMLS